jgi:hypothetical protein
MQKQIYAVYKGDELQFHGTIDDIVEVTLLSKSTIKNYSRPSYLQKVENSETALKIIKIPGAFR